MGEGERTSFIGKSKVVGCDEERKIGERRREKERERRLSVSPR